MFSRVVCLILFLATSVYSQTVSPITVETLPSTTPTAIRTGEPFSQTYKISFLESPRISKRVIVLVDQIRPRSLPTSLGNFQVIGFNLDSSGRYIKKGEEADEHIWYLKYTFRIINPKKGKYVIPKIKIRWMIVDNGITTYQGESETQEVVVSYVSTIPEGSAIQIRDDIELGDSSQANLMWYISRFGAPMCLTMLLVAYGAFLRIKKRSIRKNIQNEGQEGIDKYAIDTKTESFGKAYKRFFREARNLENDFSYDSSNCNVANQSLTMEKRLAGALLGILSSVLDIKPGDTPADISAYINKSVKEGSYKDNLILLQEELALCRDASEVGRPLDLNAYTLRVKLNKLRNSSRCLKMRWRVMNYLKKKFSRGGTK